MSESMLCTVEDIRGFLRKTLSERRFFHCEGVASSMRALFEQFGFPETSLLSYHGMDVSDVVGLMHDAAREYSDSELLRFASAHSLALAPEMVAVPVLSHGVVAHGLALELIGSDIPLPWLDAMDWHTTGNVKMGYIGMALFIADFIEPGRTFLDDAKRREYLGHDDMNQTASAILDDMIAHWKSKGIVPSESSSVLQKFFHDGGRIIL
jgi:HD superfamily phosphohydrolase YqeK